MQLYEKVVSPKGKVTYKEHIPAPESITALEMTDTQMLTVAGALGVTLLTLYERVLPPHKRIARKVKGVQDAVLDLYAGSGGQVDSETLDWFAKAWDDTMRSMTVPEAKAVPEAKNDL